MGTKRFSERVWTLNRLIPLRLDFVDCTLIVQSLPLVETHWGNGWFHSSKLWQFRHRLSCASSGIHHPCRFGCQIGAAACHGIRSCATVPGASALPRNSFLPGRDSHRRKPRRWIRPYWIGQAIKRYGVTTRWCSSCAGLPFALAPRVFSSKYLELCWWQGPVSEYLVMLTCSLPVAGLVWKQETAKSSSWMGYSIARKRSQFAYFLYGFAWGQHPCGRPIGK